MPTEVATQRAIDLVRAHVAWWPADAERVWLGLTTTDPAEGTLSEPDWLGYARQVVSALDVVRIHGGGDHVCRFWCNTADEAATIHGWFATDDVGRVLYVCRMRKETLRAEDGIDLCFVPSHYGQAVPLDALREGRP